MFKNTVSAILIIIASIGYYSFAHDLSKSEPLYGVSFSENTIEIKVKSTGCTKAADFKIDAIRDSQEYVLSIYRIKKDRCRARSRFISINLELAAPEGLPLRISNLFYN